MSVFPLNLGHEVGHKMPSNNDDSDDNDDIQSIVGFNLKLITDNCELITALGVLGG